MRINRPDSTGGFARMVLQVSFSALLAGAVVSARAQGPGEPAPASLNGGAPPAQAGVGVPAAKPVEPPTEAERFVDQAIKTIAKLKSVSADLVQEVNMLNQNFKIQGHYLRAPNSRIRMDLSVADLPDTQAKLLQVSDGQTLWEYQQVFDTRFCRKKNIKLILERLAAPELEAEDRERVTSQLGLAGPEALLIGLRKTIKFEEMEEGTLDGKPVVIITGNWRDRTGLVGPDQKQVPLIGQLPPYIPSLAKLTLGKEDLWPYKLSLVGKLAPSVLQSKTEKGPDGKPKPKQPLADKVVPTSIVLTYSNVQINPTLSEDEFKFDPPREVQTEDQTEPILASLDQAIKYRGVTKKASAASKTEVPVLDRSIDVPLPPGATKPQ